MPTRCSLPCSQSRRRSSFRQLVQHTTPTALNSHAGAVQFPLPHRTNSVKPTRPLSATDCQGCTQEIRGIQKSFTNEQNKSARAPTLFLQAPKASTMARWSLLPCANACRALSALACSPNGRWNGALSLCRACCTGRGARRVRTSLANEYVHPKYGARSNVAYRTNLQDSSHISRDRSSLACRYIRTAHEANPKPPSKWKRASHALSKQTRARGNYAGHALTNAAAIVRIGSRHCSIAAISRSLPMHASMGRWAR